MSDVRFTGVTPHYFSTGSMAGGKNVRGFCPTCGSRISGGLLSETVGILAGTLDDPSIFKSAPDVHVADAQPWDRPDSATKTFDRYPS